MPFQTSKRPTVAFIDLEALENNFNSARSFIGPDPQYMAVVKADAYGHGAVECARRLESAGADWFGVVIPEEGVELRLAGITRPILCLGSFWPGQEGLIVDHALTPVIFNERIAECLNAYAARLEISTDIHVKIDTGMGRVGIRYDDAGQFAKEIKQFKHLRITGLLTHFAAADDPDEDEFTDLQIDRFEAALVQFRNAGHDPELIDLANSPAAVRNPRSHGNLIRLGGALYGLLDDILRPETSAPDLKPVMTLRSRIADLKQVPAGEGVGYSRTFTTTRDSVIALVPCGYADGYPRNLSNIGRAMINGFIVPAVGRISMDWTLFDVTDVPGVSTGDEVVLFGSEIRASELAGKLGTIAYEITCGITKRVPRVYE